VSCCGGSCCSWDKRTAATVVDIKEGDVVNEMARDKDKTSDDAADDEVDYATNVDDDMECTTRVLRIS